MTLGPAAASKSAPARAVRPRGRTRGPSMPGHVKVSCNPWMAASASALLAILTRPQPLELCHAPAHAPPSAGAAPPALARKHFTASTRPNAANSARTSPSDALCEARAKNNCGRGGAGAGRARGARRGARVRSPRAGVSSVVTRDAPAAPRGPGRLGAHDRAFSLVYRGTNANDRRWGARGASGAARSGCSSPPLGGTALRPARRAPQAHRPVLPAGADLFHSSGCNQRRGMREKGPVRLPLRGRPG